MDSFEEVISKATEAVASLEAVRRSARAGQADLDELDRRIDHARLAATYAQRAKRHLRRALCESMEGEGVACATN